ncbi:MAG: C25 family cysteine peptidase, partial [bacterium]
MDSVDGAPATSEVGEDETFVDVLRIEEDKKPIPHAVDEVDNNLWVWTKLVASEGKSGAENFAFAVDSPAADGEAALLVHLHGGSEANADADQRVEIELNGSSIGTATWDGKVRHTAQLTFDAKLLIEGEKTLTLTARLPEGVKHSMTYVDAFDLIFPRHYGASNGQVKFFADDNDGISVGGFQGEDIRILDVSRSQHPLQVTHADILAERDGGYRATFAPTNPRGQYAAFTPASALAAEESEPGRNGLLSAPSNAADYVIITVPEWVSTVQPLADWRSSEGLETMIVTTDQIFNEFGHGEPNPRLIRQFLSTAFRRWTTAPRYVLLVGNGTYDYRGATGADDNLIPAAMTRTEEGMLPSDMMLGDVVGNDAVAEIAVGRLPAISANQAADMISKIIDYETTREENWNNDAMLAAGKTDAAGDFKSNLETLRNAVFAERRTTSIYADGDSETAREAWIDGMNRGTRLVGYVGHGGFDQLADGNLFAAADVETLDNGAALPIVVAATCHAGNFAEAGRTSLAESLIL